MALPLALIPLAAAGIGAAAGAYSSWRNRRKQKEQNEADRQHELEVLEKQREWSLSDWDKQNAYNSPEEQMNRLRQAGLNPHLVYGKGADNTAAAINQTKSTPSSKPAPFMAPLNTSGIQNAILQHAQIKQMSAQTDNLYEQNQLLQKEMLVKDMDIAGKGIKNARDKFDYELANELRENTIEAANIDVEMKKQNMYLALNEDERRSIQTSTNVQKTMQDIVESKIRVLKIQAETENDLKNKVKIEQEVKNLEMAHQNMVQAHAKGINDLIFQEYEKRLNHAGLERSSPAALKIFVNTLHDVKRLGKYWYKKIKD